MLEKRDLDSAASSSIRVQSDLYVAKDGTVVVSYANDVVTDARLRVVVLAPPAADGVGARPVVVTDEDGASIAVDGLTVDQFDAFGLGALFEVLVGQADAHLGIQVE